MSGPPIDLLGQKRSELGLPTATPQQQSSRILVVRGGLLAACCLALSGLVLFSLLRQEQTLSADVQGLRALAQRADQMNAQVQSARSRTQSAQADLAQMTQRLVAISSGSAWMEQLKRVTPGSIQLLNVAVGATQIDIQGVAVRQPSTVGPLEQINALVLNLEGLPGVPDEGVQLKNVVRSDDAVEFNLLIKVDQSYNATVDDLLELNAVGLARRHQWLRAKELPL